MNIMNKLGIGLLVVAFAFSILKTTGLVGEGGIAAGRKKKISYVHWHLEGGWQEGLDALAEDYEQTHPDVDIQQIRVSGNANYYHIYITTKLLGGTAPDLVSLGREPDGYIPRYYIPLDPYISKPNPHNKGTDLEDVPWRDTYIDGMQGGYREQYLSYYGAPLAILVRRVYYNKTLFQEVLGTDLRPQDILDWPAFAKRIVAEQAAGEPTAGKRLWPFFSQESKDALRAAADGNALTDAQKKTIVGDINGVLLNSAFYNPEVVANFAEVIDHPEIESILSDFGPGGVEAVAGSHARMIETFDEMSGQREAGELSDARRNTFYYLRAKVKRFNRLLIEESYPGLIVDSDIETLEPSNFRQFIDVCKRFEEWSKATRENQQRKVVPIAAIGSWTSGMLVGQYITGTTANRLRELDINRNGRTGSGPGVKGIQGEKDETYFALLMDRFEWDDPYLRAAYRMIDEIKDYFQEGFVGTQWDDGKFLFGQGNAAMMPTGSWETKSLMAAAEEAGFEIGAFPFPFPDEGHPKYGRYVAGKVSEQGLPSTGEIGVYRYSDNLEQALDYLQFMTSRKSTVKLSKYTLWYPAIKGAEKDPEVDRILGDYKPQGEGYFGGAALSLGKNTSTYYNRQIKLWLSGDWTLEKFFEEYRKKYFANAKQDIEDEVLAPLRRHVASTEREIDAARFTVTVNERRLADVKENKPVDPDAPMPPANKPEEIEGQIDRWSRREAELIENQLNSIFDFALKSHLTEKLATDGND
mgnify:CR=1 FL=1